MLAVPKNHKKQKCSESKSLSAAKKANESNAWVEVPAKKEAPKKENKKIKASCRRKEKPIEPLKKTTTRRKKSASLSADHSELPNTKPVKDVSPQNTREERHPKTESKEIKVESKESEVEKKTSRSMSHGKRISRRKEKSFDMEMARKYLKHVESQQRSRPRIREENSLMETMPDSTQMSAQMSSTSSMRSFKSTKSKKSKKVDLLDRNIFKENGEPVWIVPDRKPGELVMNANGELVKFPELEAALEEDGLEMEDGKGWIKKISDYLSGVLDTGKSEDKPSEIDPYAPMEELEEHTEEFFRKECVIYNTADAVFSLCDSCVSIILLFLIQSFPDVMERLQEQEAGGGVRRPNLPKVPSREAEEKTCVLTSIKFDLEAICLYHYDRRCPVASIRKLNNKLASGIEQVTQPGD